MPAKDLERIIEDAALCLLVVSGESRGFERLSEQARKAVEEQLRGISLRFRGRRVLACRVLRCTCPDGAGPGGGSPRAPRPGGGSVVLWAHDLDAFVTESLSKLHRCVVGHQDIHLGPGETGGGGAQPELA